MQATPGKRWAKVKVTSNTGNNVNVVQSAIRNGCKVLSLVLLFSGFIAILFNDKRKALHDYIGGTLVLFDED